MGPEGGPLLLGDGEGDGSPTSSPPPPPPTWPLMDALPSATTLSKTVSGLFLATGEVEFLIGEEGEGVVGVGGGDDDDDGLLFAGVPMLRSD